MKKINRLLKNEDFQTVIGKKKIYSNKSFVVYYKDNSLDHIRIGISVSKKLGKAVIRNKAKRQVRMMCQDLFDTNLGLDLVIILRNEYINNDYSFNFSNLKFIQEKIYKEKKYEKDI